jgi:hypothetical protein
LRQKVKSGYFNTEIVLGEHYGCLRGAAMAKVEPAFNVVYGGLLHGTFGFKSTPPRFGFTPSIQNILVQEMRNISVFQNFQQFCFNVIVHCVVDAALRGHGVDVRE